MPAALIVIDMQEGSFTPRGIRHDSAGLVDRLNALAARVREVGGLVIFIQHDGPECDPHHPSQPGWLLLAELDVQSGDKCLSKSSCDAFLDTNLDRLLAKEEVDRLIITGCATDYCVDTTIRSALARGYATVAPSDGHTTADRSHLTAPQIIAHHNAVWADFLSPAGAALVVPCGQIGLAS